MPQHDPGRNYDALFLLSLVVLGGLAEWIPRDTPDTITRLMPAYAFVYHVLLLIGGVLALVGMGMSRVQLSAPLEAAGRIVLTTTLGYYTLMLLLLVRPVPVVTAMTLLAFSVICGVRVRQLWVQINLARRVQIRSQHRGRPR